MWVCERLVFVNVHIDATFWWKFNPTDSMIFSIISISIDPKQFQTQRTTQRVDTFNRLLWLLNYWLSIFIPFINVISPKRKSNNSIRIQLEFHVVVRFFHSFLFRTTIFLFPYYELRLKPFRTMIKQRRLNHVHFCSNYKKFNHCAEDCHFRPPCENLYECFAIKSIYLWIFIAFIIVSQCKSLCE